MVLWALLIFSFSSQPTGTVSEIHWEDFIVKKTAHVVVYFVLTMFTYRGLINSGVEKKKAGIISIIFSVLYGFTDEFHQGFTPGRDPRIRDVFFDTIGSGLFIYSIWKLPRYQKLSNVMNKIIHYLEL